MNCFGIYSSYSNFGWRMWLWKHIVSILSYTHKELVFKSLSVIYAQILWHYIGPFACFSQVPQWIPNDAVFFPYKWINKRNSYLFYKYHCCCDNGCAVKLDLFQVQCLPPFLRAQKRSQEHSLFGPIIRWNLFLMFYWRMSREDMAAVGGDVWPASHPSRLTELRPWLCWGPSPEEGSWWHNGMNLNQNVAKMRTYPKNFWAMVKPRGFFFLA